MIYRPSSLSSTTQLAGGGRQVLLQKIEKKREIQALQGRISTAVDHSKSNLAEINLGFFRACEVQKTQEEVAKVSSTLVSCLTKKLLTSFSGPTLLQLLEICMLQV